MENKLAINVGMEIEGLRRGIIEAKKLTSNYTEFVKENSARQTRLESESQNKTVEEIRKARRQALTDLDNSYKQAIEKAKSNGAELRKIDENYAKHKREINENTEKQIAGSIAKWKDKVNDIVREAEAKNEKEVKRARTAILKEIDTQYKHEIQMAKQAGESIAAIQREHVQKTAFVKSAGITPAIQKAAPALPGFGGAIQHEAIKGAQEYAGALGPVGGILGKIHPVGLAVGAALGVVTDVMYEGIKAAEEYEGGITRIKTLLNEKQEAGLPDAMEKLRESSMRTGAPLSQLQTTMYNLISSVPAYANNLNAAAAASENAAKLGKALGASTDTVALAMGNLGNAANLNLTSLEDQKFIMDALAQTMNAGVIPSGEALAGNIAKAQPIMASMTKTGREAVLMNAELTTVLTQNGVTIEESQTRIASFGNALQDVEQRTALIKAGLKGISETGQITDINALAESLSKDVNKFTALVGRKETADVFRILAKNGGESFREVTEGFKNMAGLSEEMYGEMASSAKVGWDRVKATTNDILITIGEGGAHMMGGVAGVTNDILKYVDDMLQSSEKKFKKAFENMKGQGDLAASAEISLKRLNDAMKTADKVAPNNAKAVLAGLGIDLKLIAEKSGVAAANEIKKIMNTEGPLPEKLEKIRVQLEAIDSVAKTNESANAMNAQQEAANALNESIQEQGSWWERNFKTILGISEVGLAGVTGGLSVAILETSGLNDKLQDIVNADVFTRMGSNVEKLQTQYDTLIQQSKGMTAGSKEYNETMVQAAAVAQELTKTKGHQANIEKATEQFVKNSITAQTTLMQGHLEDLDVERAYADAIVAATNANKDLAKDAGFQAKLRKDIEAQIEPIKQKAALEAKFHEAALLSGDAQKDYLIGLMQSVDQTKFLEMAKTTQGLKEEDIKKLIDSQNDSLLAQLELAHANNMNLTEAQEKEYERLKALKLQADNKAADLAYQNNKNTLLISQKALEDGIGLATKATLDNDTLTTAEKSKSLQLMIEKNAKHIEELDSLKAKTPEQLAEVENLRVANNILIDKRKEVDGETKAQHLLSGILSEQTIELNRQIKIQEQKSSNANQHLDIAQKELELKLASGQITDLEYQQQSKEILIQRLEVEMALLKALQAEKGHGKEALEQQKKVLDLEISIANANKKQKEGLKPKTEEQKSTVSSKGFEDQKAYNDKLTKMREDELQRRNDLAVAAQLAERERIKQLREFNEQIKNIISNMKNKAFGDIASLVEPFKTPAQKLVNTIGKLQMAADEEMQALKKIDEGLIKQGLAAAEKYLDAVNKKAYVLETTFGESVMSKQGKSNMLIDAKNAELTLAQAQAYEKAHIEALKKRQEKDQEGLNLAMQGMRQAFKQEDIAIMINIAEKKFKEGVISGYERLDRQKQILVDSLVRAYENQKTTQEEIAKTAQKTSYKETQASYVKDIQGLQDQQTEFENVLKMLREKLSYKGKELSLDDMQKMVVKLYYEEKKKAAEKQLDPKILQPILAQLNQVTNAFKLIGDDLDVFETQMEKAFSITSLEEFNKVINTIENNIQINNKTLEMSNITLGELEKKYNKSRIELLKLAETKDIELTDDQKALLEQIPILEERLQMERKLIALMESVKFEQQKILEHEEKLNSIREKARQEADKDKTKITKETYINPFLEIENKYKKENAQYDKEIAELNIIINQELSEQVKIQQELADIRFKMAKLYAELLIAQTEYDKAVKSGDDDAIKRAKEKFDQLNIQYKQAQQNEDRLEKLKVDIDKRLKDSSKDLYDTKQKQGENNKKQFDEEKNKADSVVSSIKGMTFNLASPQKFKEIIGAIGKEFQSGDISKGLKGIADLTQTTSDLIQNTMQDIGSMTEALSSGNVGAGVKSIADMSKKIGMALLEAPYPLNIVGGVMYLGGTVAGIVGDIISQIVPPQKTASEIAKSRLDSEMQIIEAYNRQIEALEILKGLEIDGYKTAKDRTKQLWDARNAAAANNSELQRATEISSVDLANEVQITKNKKDQLEAEKAQFEELTKSSNYYTGLDMAESLITKYGLDHDKLENIFGNIDYTKLKSELEALGYQYDGIVAADEAELEFRKQILEATKMTVEEAVKYAKTQYDLLKSLKTAEGDYYSNYALAKQVDIERLDFEKKFGKILDTQNQSADELYNNIANILTSTPEQLEALGITQEMLDSMQSFMSIYQDQLELEEENRKKLTESAKNEMDAKRRRFEYLKKTNDYLNATQQESDEMHKTNLQAILTDELAYEKSVLETLLAQNASNTEIWDQKSKIMDVEKQIYDLMHGQSDVQDEQLKKVKEMNRTRNQMLMQAQLTGNVAGIAEIEQKIIDTLKASGASDAQIQAQIATFRNTFSGSLVTGANEVPQTSTATGETNPLATEMAEQTGGSFTASYGSSAGGFQPVQGFATGTSRTQEGLAYLHADEAILKARAAALVDQEMPGFIDKINAKPDYGMLNELAAGYFTSQNKLEQAKMYYTSHNLMKIDLGGITINAGNNANPSDIAIMARKEIERAFTGKGIQLGHL